MGSVAILQSMGSVAILQSKDCLIPRRSSLKPNPNPNPNRIANPDMNRSVGRRKRSPGRNSTTVNDKNNATKLTTPAKLLVMEQVKILKRGEVLEDMTNTKPVTKADTVYKRTGLNKNNKKVKFEDLVAKIPNLYAGLGFFQSPSPRSLPLPVFFSKKL